MSEFSADIGPFSFSTGSGTYPGWKIKRDRRVAYEQALGYAPTLAANTEYATQTANYNALRDSGLHPAFAHGIGSSSSPVITGGTPSGAGGRDNGVASYKQVNKYEALMNEANLGLIKARTDEIQERVDACT